MRVKTFRGTDTKTVLGRIKEELGDDAVILSTRNYREDGCSVCEMTAALEDDPRPAQAKHQAERQAQAPGPQDGPDARGFEEWQREWRQIKEHLLDLVKPRMDYAGLSQSQKLSLQYLEREGVAQEIVLDLFKELKRKAGRTVLAPLERLVRVRAWGRRGWPGRLHAVAGPHGVGKTSLVIRLALQERRRSKKARILLVNMDNARSHGRMLLRHYAELAELEYREAEDAGALDDIAADPERWDRVFIDLPGLGRDATLDRFLYRTGLDRLDGLSVHLALSPAYSQEQLMAFARQYASDTAASLVWTKVDESCHFGSMINTAAATDLPVSMVSHGPGLRDTLSPAAYTMLWRLVFKHQLPGADKNTAGAAKPQDAPATAPASTI